MRNLSKLLNEKSLQDTQAMQSYLNPTKRDIFNSSANNYVQVDMDRIIPNKSQPRLIFDETELQVLADSIQELGLLQPIIVRSSGNNQYEIVAGERRYRAYQLLEKQYIDCIIIDIDDEKNSLLALAENINRSDLSDYEIAKSIFNFKHQFPNKTEFAKILGISRQYLYRLLSFEKLPTIIQDRLTQNPHLLSAKTSEQIEQFVKKNNIHDDILTESLNNVLDMVISKNLKQNFIVNELEKLINKKPTSITTPTTQILKIFAIENKNIGKIKKSSNKTIIEFDSFVLDKYQIEIEVFFENLLKKHTTQS